MRLAAVGRRVLPFLALSIGVLLPARPAGAVVYYVNDGLFDASDSWTSAAGDTLNTGLLPSSPKISITQALALALAGDTVYVDAGTFGETVLIPADGISIIGVDSSLTILDLRDSSAGTNANGIAAVGRSGLLFRNLQVRNSYRGCSFTNVDLSTVENVLFRYHAFRGVALQDGSDTNVFRNVEVRNVSNVGVELTASSFNRFDTVTSSSNASRGFVLQGGSHENVLSTCLARSNAADGFYLTASHRNRLVGCLARSNTLDGFEAASADDNLFAQNRSDSNTGYQFRITGTSSRDTFTKNVIAPDTFQGVRSDVVETTFAWARNWWGSIDSQAVDSMTSGAGADSILFTPWRLGVPDTTPGADTVAPRAPDTVAVTDSGAVTLTVSWAPVVLSEEAEAAVGLASYRIYRSRTPDTHLWVLAATAGPAALSVIDSPLAPNDTFYYRVTAVDAAAFPNESFFSDSIAVGNTQESVPPTAFQTLGPPQGHETTVASCTFAWTASTDDSSPPVTYVIRTSSVSNFASFVDSAVGANTSAVFTFPKSDTYFWRVIASDAVGNTTVAGDSLVYFDTEPPVPFSLSTPANAAETSLASPVFSWQAAPDSATGLNRYQFQISTSPGLSPLLADSSSTVETFSLPLAANDTYYWRVIAYDDAGNSRVSNETRALTVETSPPIPFLLRSPAQFFETRANSISFSWDTSLDSSPYALSYAIRYSKLASFATFTESASGTNTGGVINLSGSDTYYWRVVVSDAAGNTTTAGDSSFIVDTTTPAAFALSSPANGAYANTTPVTFQWSASSDTHSGLNRYMLQVSTFADFFTLLYDSTAGTATSLVAQFGAAATYYWRVIAFDDVGNTKASTDSRTLLVETGPPAAFRLLSPADGFETRLSPVALTWEASDDSTSPPVSYTVRRSTVSNFASFIDSAVGTNTSANLVLTSSDTIYWRVIATDNGGNTTVAGDSSFVFDVTAPSVPTLVDPTGGETRLSPVPLDWNASTDSHAGVLRYRLQVANNASFNTPVVDSLVTVPDTTVALGNGTYWWRVFAEDDVGNSVSTSSDTFVVPDTAAPTIVFYYTSPESPTTTLDTIIVVGRVVDSETPATVAIRRVGPLTTSDSDLAVTAGGDFSGPFPVEASGDSRTTSFRLTVADLGGNSRQETISVTRVDSVLATTVVDSVATASAVLADSAGASLSIEQETATAVSLTLVSDTAYADTVEVRIDFAAGWTGGAVVVRRPTDAATLLSDTSLALGLAADSAGRLSRYLVEILVYDSAGNPIGSSTDAYAIDTANGRGIRLVFHYREADFDVNERNLAVHFYDPATGTWTLVSDSSLLSVLDLGLDMVNDTLGHVVRHLTIFAPIPTGVGASGSLDNVVIFPNPFVPNDGNPATGLPFSGTVSAANATGIHIMNLTPRVKIAIYDLHGAVVDEITNLTTQGLAIWDARDRAGREVASGVYLVVVTDLDTGRTAVRKVAIVR